MSHYFKGEYPYLRLIIPFLMGMGCSFLIDFSPIVTHFSIIISLLLLIFLWIFNHFYRKYKFYQYPYWIGISIGSYMLIAGVSTVQNQFYFQQVHQHFSQQKAVCLKVRVCEEPIFKQNIIKFKAYATKTYTSQQSQCCKGYLLVSIRRPHHLHPMHIQYGDELILPANFTTITPPSNPYMFNYQHYLHTQHINHQIFVEQKNCFLTAHNKGNKMLTMALHWRKKVVKKYQQWLSKDAAALASTLILGYRSQLDQEVIQTYSRTGTIHILSVSGMHLALIYMMLNFMLKFLEPYPLGKHLKVISIVTLIWTYALITGFSPSVSRAAVMITFFTLGKNYAKNTHPLNILAASGFILLLYNPLYLVDVGFQLSYLSLIGLFIIVPVLQPHFVTSYKWLNYLIELIIVSIAATLSTFPISVYYFHQFPLYFILSNIIIALPASIIMYTGIALGILPLPSNVLTLLAYSLEKTNLYAHAILYRIEHLPYATIDKIFIQHWHYIILYAIIISLLLINTQRYKIPIFTILILTLTISINYSLNRIQQMQQRKLIIHNIQNHIALSILDGKNGYVLTNLNSKHPNVRFSVQPCLDYFGALKITLINWQKDTLFHHQNMQRYRNFIQIFNHRLWIYDSNTPLPTDGKTISVDIAIIHKQPWIDLERFLQSIRCKTLIISGNTPKKLKKWQMICAKQNITCHPLKTKGDLIIN